MANRCDTHTEVVGEVRGRECEVCIVEGSDKEKGCTWMQVRVPLGVVPDHGLLLLVYMPGLQDTSWVPARAGDNHLGLRLIHFVSIFPTMLCYCRWIDVSIPDCMNIINVFLLSLFPYFCIVQRQQVLAKLLCGQRLAITKKSATSSLFEGSDRFV